MPKIRKDDIYAYTDKKRILCQPCGHDEGLHLYVFQVVTKSMLEKMKGDDHELYCDVCGELIDN